MATKLSPFPVGIPAGSSYYSEIYERTRYLVNQLLSSISWNTITGKPTTLPGYGVATTGSGTAVAQTSPTLITPNIGAATGTSLALSGAITIGDVAALVKSSVAMNNGAAAAAGTLLNAPAAGNPTKWIPINDNGTIRYIPSW